MWPVLVCIACTHLAAATAAMASELSYKKNHLKVFHPNIRMSHLALACNPKQSIACSSELCTTPHIGKVCHCVCALQAAECCCTQCTVGRRQQSVYKQQARPVSGVHTSGSSACSPPALAAVSANTTTTPATHLSRSQARVLRREAGFSTSSH